MSSSCHFTLSFFCYYKALQINAYSLFQFSMCVVDNVIVLLHGIDILGGHLEFPDIMDSVERKNGAHSGNTEVVLPPAKRTKMDPAFGVLLINNANLDQLTQKMVHPRSSEALSELLLFLDGCDLVEPARAFL